MNTRFAYAIDWLVAVLSFGCGIGLEFVSPFQRRVMNDESISYPYATSETVPSFLLIILGCVIPALVLFLYQFFVKKLSMKEIHPGILGLFLSVSLTYLTSNFIKLAVGRPRPDFLDRCRPVDINAKFITCQGSPALLRDGRKSFPSGHASYSFAGLGYLSIFLLGHLQIHGLAGRSLKLIAVGVPLLAALLVGISRIDDYRHHWQDVLAGDILGLIVAYSSYRQYYPCPTSPDSNLLSYRKSEPESSATIPLMSSDSNVPPQETSIVTDPKLADTNV